METRIAICSLSCRLPDAASPDALWRNLIEGRRAFRPIPPRRLALGSYAAAAIGEADSITPVQAGLISGWRFDREAFRVPKSAYENTDLSHWLALELADAALQEIGGAARLDRARTAVIVANTLTGEFSRAALLRLRQPFLDEILGEALAGAGLDEGVFERLRSGFRDALRDRFPEPNEDTLAGGLANTIAGRIANHFDLKGGAYTVDGACASSLVAVADAAALLEAGSVDAAVVGAVDLSLDPFELVGFSRNGALARDRMRVFDARANGFWPGEGGVFCVMMRARDAARAGLPVRAHLRGWGMSTDGAGGLTRPDSEGQLLASRRACEKAGIDPGDLAYVEAHGTGTAVGDPAEVTALAALRAGAPRPLRIGSIKANIGHTKAAAGFAGLVKTVMALERGGVPAHVGCEVPHRVFRDTGGAVAPPGEAAAFDESRATIAGVSSFGFGGINMHVVLEAASAASPAARRAFVAPSPRLGEQEAELFLFAADDPAVLTARLAPLAGAAAELSLAELADAAAGAARAAAGPVRLAMTAADGGELAQKLHAAIAWLESGAASDPPAGLHAGSGGNRARIGFLFSGQAAPVRPPSPVWLERFPGLKPLARRLKRRIEDGDPDTENAQPAIAFANLAALAVLDGFGIEARAAAGHSLGEIAALAWAGMLTPEAAIDLASGRGQAMAGHARPGGGMVRLALSPERCAGLVEGLACSIACFNGPSEQIVSGSGDALERLRERAGRCGVAVQPLRVSHAFHSPDMAPAAGPFGRLLADLALAEPSRPFVSTVTGGEVSSAAGARDLLVRQLTEPVRFDEALASLADSTDLLFELGPGTGLSRLAAGRGLPVHALDSQGPSLRPLLEAVAAAFAAGHDIRTEMLLEKRGLRPFDVAIRRSFLESPCGSRGDASPPVAPPAVARSSSVPRVAPRPETPPAVREGRSALAATLQAVAEEAGFAVAAIDPASRFQSDLHMNSLAVTRIVLAAARSLGVAAPHSPTDYADATPAGLAAQLAETMELGSAEAPRDRVAGIRAWSADYAMGWHGCVPLATSGDGPAWLTGPDEAGRAGAGLRIDLEGAFGPEEGVALIARLRRAVAAGLDRLAVIHDGAPVSACLRSVFQEGRFAAILLVDRAGARSDDPRIATLLRAAPASFAEFRLGRDGGFETPSFERTEAARAAAGFPGAGETVLALGCAKGIGAECALRLARSGARVVFVGRSAASDPDVAATLALAAERRIECEYRRCDITDPEAAFSLAAGLARAGTSPSFLLFAPARNEPARLEALSEAEVAATLAPKSAGLDYVLRSFGPGLKQIVAFGSIIGRIGLDGESHYALANTMQAAALERFARARPDCRCLGLEWTVWSGAGMGERLGTIDRLAARGVDALSFDEALDAFERHVASGSRGAICVTSRFGNPPGLRTCETDRPASRFLDEVLVDYPGTEIVVATQLSHGRDRYLGDHRVDGVSVFPGVMALEAMGQTAAALGPLPRPPITADVVFARAILVPDGESVSIRIAALRSGPDRIEAAIFSSADGFGEPCFRAEFRQAAEPDAHGDATFPVAAAPAEPFPAASLYGPLFFHTGRFAVARRVLSASSREIDVEIGGDRSADWFAAFEPSRMVLGDPAAADAGLHVLQLTLPHRRVLPVGIASFQILEPSEAIARITARENWAGEGEYSFDMTAWSAEGRPAMRWRDARFRTVGAIDPDPVLDAAPQLAEAYLERLAREELQDDTIRVVLETGPTSRAARRQAVLRRLGIADNVFARGDGRPQLPPGRGHVGLSHTTDATLAVLSANEIACDLVTDRSGPGGLGALGLAPAEGWAVAEVGRKLGDRSAVSRALGATPPAASANGAMDTLTRRLPRLGLCVAIGRLRVRPVRGATFPERSLERCVWPR